MQGSACSPAVLGSSQEWCTWCWSPFLKERCLTSVWCPSASVMSACWRSHSSLMSCWECLNRKRPQGYSLFKTQRAFQNMKERTWLGALAVHLQALLKARTVLKEDYGCMHVCFGNPVSVRDLVKGNINSRQFNLVPR